MSSILPAQPSGSRRAMPLGSPQRALGAYYTPDFAADLMADWIIRNDGSRLLEPSMGDGVFVRALNRACERRGLGEVEVFGIEMSEDAFRQAVAGGLLPLTRATQSDFLRVEPFPCDGVIGNPPYVRLRHLPRDQAEVALSAAERLLGHAMDPSGSVWMPFVLHSLSFLQPGGRLALVLPYDFTYVRYARPLWRKLRGCFGSLRVIRVRERIFPDLLQEVVLFFADEYGSTTQNVEFEAFDTTAQFADGTPDATSTISIADIEDGSRPFTEALLPSSLRWLLRSRVNRHTVEMRDLVRFNIGYVAGDKRFFHPSAASVDRHGLPAESLRPAVTSARQVRGAGIFTSGLDPSRRSWLFAPAPSDLEQEEESYIASGVEEGVSERYKCRVRSPWYLVPGLRTPDLLVSVFSEQPCMLVNDARLLASNSLLCGYLRPGVDPRHLVAAWYTPLTALELELHIHALGGGVFVLVPNEIAQVRVPTIDRCAMSLAGLDRLVRDWDIRGAHEWGREHVLRRVLGLTPEEIDLIERGRDVLMRWRKSSQQGAASGQP